jgi:hypothetical protein
MKERRFSPPETRGEMIKLVLSFTYLLTKADLDSLDGALFFFGCARENVFEDEPGEITWGQGEEVNRKRLVQIREMLLKAEAEDRVEYRKRGTRRLSEDGERQLLADLLRFNGLSTPVQFKYMSYPNIKDALEGRVECLY